MENINFKEEDIITFDTSEKDAVFIERQLLGHTKLDIEIHSLPLPKKPVWLRIVVKAIRWYQKTVSHKLGNRCVFDPSCSRYSEQAYRERGFIRGSILTVKRLHRCKPKNGGKDLLEIRK